MVRVFRLLLEIERMTSQTAYNSFPEVVRELPTTTKTFDLILMHVKCKTVIFEMENGICWPPEMYVHL